VLSFKLIAFAQRLRLADFDVERWTLGVGRLHLTSLARRSLDGGG